ncbi:hypothetical protein MHYP_G00308990 [Metynnis hypsauchen]
MAIRATPHEATGVSPFELMTGRRMTLPLHLLYQPGEASIAVAYTTHQYMEDLQKHLRATFAFAQKKLEKSAEGRKAYYDQKASFDELQVGDKVWYYTFAPPTGVLQNKTNKLTRKLLPHWSGPHIIMDKLSPVVYQIQISRSRGEQVCKMTWLLAFMIVGPITAIGYLPGIGTSAVNAVNLATVRRQESASSIDNLAMGRIPRYLVPLTLVQEVLTTANRETVTDLQAHLAYTLGNAAPIYVSPQERELAFLVNLPIIASENTYRLKDVVNVGFWQKEAYVQQFL